MNKEKLEFATFCVGAVANSLNCSRQDVYERLKSSGIFKDYIIKHYDELHTFSRTYIVKDIIEYMKEKGVLA